MPPGIARGNPLGPVLGGLSWQAALSNGFLHRCEVALVLIGASPGVFDDRTFEAGGFSEVGGDRDPIARTSVGAGERPPAHAAPQFDPRGSRACDVGRRAPVAQPSHVVVAGRSLIRVAVPTQEDVVVALNKTLPVDDALTVVGERTLR